MHTWKKLYNYNINVKRYNYDCIPPTKIFFISPYP